MATLKDIWLNEMKSLADAYKPRPARVYVVDGIFRLPSLNIVYGSPGSMKSMLMSDCGACVSAGLSWLDPLPNDKSGAVRPIRTIKSPVLWLDFDNGGDETMDRFEAFGRKHSIPESEPLYWVSMPSLPFDSTKPAAIMEVVDTINAINAKLVIIDTLLSVSGAADENAPEIGKVMQSFRLVAEKTGAAVVLIHHERKQSGSGGKAGDALRGHSSINGAVDLALRVERVEGTDAITCKSTKTRSTPVEPFSALFSYDHKPGTRDLAEARFWGRKAQDAQTQAEIEDAVLRVLKAAGKPLNQTDMKKAVKVEGITRGDNTIRAVLESMGLVGSIKVSTGAKGAILYEI